MSHSLDGNKNGRIRTHTGRGGGRNTFCTPVQDEDCGGAAAAAQLMAISRASRTKNVKLHFSFFCLFLGSPVEEENQ
jgi:hypothetical protein